MPIDANIPLSGIAPKLPSAGELVSLQSMIEQMRERKLRSDQQTAELASDKALEGLAAGLSAYYGAPAGTTEDQRKVMMRTAQREYFEQLDKSGQGRLYGWNSQKIQEFAHHEIEPERAEMILDQTAKYKDLVKHGRNIRAGEIEAGPAQPQQGVSLGQVGQPPAPQQQQAPGVPMPDQTGVPPGQVALGVQPTGPNEFQSSELPVTAEMPAETTKGLYRKAQDRDDKASQLRRKGLTEEAKVMAAEGQHFRTSAAALERTNQGDLKLDQAEERMKQGEVKPYEPATLERLGIQRLMFGELPRGMGNASGKQRQMVEEQADRQAFKWGLTHEEAARLSYDNKVKQKAVDKMTTWGAFVSKSADQLNQSMDLAIQYAEKLGPGQLKAINEAILRGETELNNPIANAYAVQVNTVRTEYERLMTGPTSNAMLPVEAMKKGQELISRAMDIPSWKEVAKSIRNDARITKSSIDNQINSLRQSEHGTTPKETGGKAELEPIGTWSKEKEDRLQELERKRGAQ